MKRLLNIMLPRLTPTVILIMLFLSNVTTSKKWFKKHIQDIESTLKKIDNNVNFIKGDPGKIFHQNN